MDQATRIHTAAQLRKAAIQTWQAIPLGMRMRIAFRRMLSYVQKGVAQAIAVLMADAGYDVPRNDRGRVDVNHPSVTELGNAIYQKVRGVLRGREDDIQDVIQDTFERVFLQKKSFKKMTGDNWSDYRGWILTAFHNAAKDRGRQLTNLRKKLVEIESDNPDEPDNKKKKEMVENQLLHTQKIPWERHPMWKQVVSDVFRALDELDQKNRDARAKFHFPTRRIFELMMVDGLSGKNTAVQLAREGMIDHDPEEVRHALNRFKNQVAKVVQTVVKKIEDKEMLDSFFDTIAA